VTDANSGVLVVDKPTGMSSHAVVARVRRATGIRKVGHAGTLDPMATGVLVLGLGRGTRLLHFLVGADKAYDATIRLGVTTATDDADGQAQQRCDARGLTEGEIGAAAERLTGEISQVPSAVSAIKVDGRRAYARVRAGEDVELEPRQVLVASFDVHRVRPAHDEPAAVDVDVSVACSSGTYVRALARDMGAALGVGGHLTSLRRTRVGPFVLADAHAMDALDDGVMAAAIPLGEAACRFLPSRVLSKDEAAQVRHGVAPRPSGAPGAVALVDNSTGLLAVAEDVGPRACLRAVFVG
jgi:tRNA pseudouridine55 synthase